MKIKLVFILLFVTLFSFSQQTEYVDFKKIEAVLGVYEQSTDTIFGVPYKIEFDILKRTDSIYLDAKNMNLEEVYLNKKTVDYKVTKNQIIIYNKFKPSKSNLLKFNYHCSPKKALYFLEKKGESQIWTQGQGKYTSNWLPSIDDMNDKIEFDLSFIANSDYTVISNGKLSDHISDVFDIWKYDMRKPMSSYLVALVIGKYNKKIEYSKSGIPLEMYYYPEDSLKFEPTYRYTKRIFDFLEEEIGVPYPWQNYKQVPVKDFLYAGMENTGTTIFSDSFVIDSIAFVDKNYVNVNAHELAHQWFGNLVTETSGTHHWLHEGFATYYALLAEKEVFGEDYYYWRLYEYAQELLEQDKAGKSTSLLNPKSSSITFYKKGAWVLHMLRIEVGNEVFKKAIKNYLLKYEFENVQTDNFIDEIEKVSDKKLDFFVKKHIKEKNVDWLRANSETLKFFQFYNANIRPPKQTIKKEEFINFKKTKNEFMIRTLFSNINQNTKIEIFNDLLKDTLVNKKELFSKIFDSKDIKIRQSIAQNLTKIPSELKADYESLLNDKSYITIETALFNLWSNFPEDRKKYLDQTKDVIGFNDKNVRILWLTLALITEDYEAENKKAYFDELTSYTSPKYGFEVRQNAFQYLSQIQACGEVCKENLKQATNHHNWRFKKFAKALLKQVEQ